MRLSAGDMIPADLRLLETKDLFINQSALTGEAMPAEKYRPRLRTSRSTIHSICRTFASWAPMSSAAMAPASSCAPAANTFFGQLADEIAGRRVPTTFDQGINRFTWLMIRFMMVMVPLVFLDQRLDQA